MCAQLCLTLGDPITVTLQGPLYMGFPRQEYCSGLPFPPPRSLPDPGIKSVSPASPELQADSLPLSPLGNPFFLSCSVAKSCLTLCDSLDCSTPGFPVLHYLPEFAQIHVHWVSDALQPSHPLLPPAPLALSLSKHQGLSNELALAIQVAKVLKLQPQSFQQISGLISYRIDWFDLLAVQGTLKSLLHHHSSKASFLGCSAFFMVQFSHMYITTGKTMALTTWVFVGKMMSLLLYTLSRFVIAFLPRSKHLLILWLQSPFTVILEPKKIKFVTVSTFPPSICHEVMGLDAMILVFLNIGFQSSIFILLFHLHQEAL